MIMTKTKFLYLTAIMFIHIFKQMLGDSPYRDLWEISKYQRDIKVEMICCWSEMTQEISSQLFF